MCASFFEIRNIDTHEFIKTRPGLQKLLQINQYNLPGGQYNA